MSKKQKPSITYTDFELVFTDYVQPPDTTALKQVFVGVQEVTVDAAVRTARIRFQQKGQAQAAYEATFNSEPRTGVYDRVISQYMPDANFDSMEEFSAALGKAGDLAAMVEEAMIQQQQRRRRR